MRALFLTFDGGGNLPPALGIARELERRRGEVRFLGHEIQREAITAAGFGFEALTRGKDYSASTPRTTIGTLRELTGLFADRGIADDALASIAAHPSDIVVVDCLLWGATDSLVRAGVPVVSFVHSLSAYFDANARGPVGLVARMRGVDPVAATRAAAITLVSTRVDLDPPGKHGYRRGLHHLGLVWQDAQPVEAEADPARPRVLVSFSTTAFPGQERALQSVLDGLAGLPIDLVVTTGAVDPASLNVPPGARVERRIDHGELLATTRLVIGHGGHATTARALLHGVPLLVMPMHPLMDQPAVGRALERLGVGRSLPKTAKPDRIREVVLALLADDAVLVTARAIGADARGRDGAVVAGDLLEAQVALRP
jgi:UDP:flavonoid glycosyltransferase YjiC (YdhE family)